MRKPLFYGLLERDVGPALQLEGALGGVSGVVLPQRAFDIGRMGLVAFDKVGIVAIDRPEKRAQDPLGYGMKTTCRSCGFRRQGQVGQLRVGGGKQGFHCRRMPIHDKHADLTADLF